MMGLAGIRLSAALPNVCDKGCSERNHPPIMSLPPEYLASLGPLANTFSAYEKATGREAVLVGGASDGPLSDPSAYRHCQQPSGSRKVQIPIDQRMRPAGSGNVDFPMPLGV